MAVNSSRHLFFAGYPLLCRSQVTKTTIDLRLKTQIPGSCTSILPKSLRFLVTFVQVPFSNRAVRKSSLCAVQKQPGKREHHLWKRRDAAGSGQKAINLVRIVSGLPNEKEAVYRALDEWVAWELEFPLIAAAKGLKILRKRSQWVRVIQVAKWMLSKGQGTTMTTYDTLLLAFDREARIDEAGSLWNMILHTHTRSIPKQLFSRMIAIYDHHHMEEKAIEVFADMEELGVKPDEDTVQRVARVFERLGRTDKKNLVIQRYGCKWKYIHFKGERVRVRRNLPDD